MLTVAKSSRRKFLALISLIFTPCEALFAKKIDTVSNGTEIFHLVCNHFIPASDTGPGAKDVELGHQLMSIYVQTSYGRTLFKNIVTGLGEQFLALSHDEQIKRLEEQLEGGKLSEQLSSLLTHCAHAYYSNPQSWPSIGYRTPQPQGYADYASHCGDTKTKMTNS